MNRYYFLLTVVLMTIGCEKKEVERRASEYYTDLAYDILTDSTTAFWGEIVDTTFFGKVDSIVSNYIKYKGDTVYLAFSYNESQNPDIDTIPISKDKWFYVLAEKNNYVFTHRILCKTDRYYYSIRSDQANIFTRNTGKKIRIKKLYPYDDLESLYSKERLAVSVYYKGELEYMDRDYYVDLYNGFYE